MSIFVYVHIYVPVCVCVYTCVRVCEMLRMMKVLVFYVHLGNTSYLYYIYSSPPLFLTFINYYFSLSILPHYHFTRLLDNLHTQNTDCL